MKNYFVLVLCACLIVSMDSIAKCKSIYTIGAYDEVFAKHATVTKLGPLSAADVPPTLPKSFLENDGSYGGGEAFCTIEKACRALIYILNASSVHKNHQRIIHRDYSQLLLIVCLFCSCCNYIQSHCICQLLKK
jgi:hypothetical protein